VHIWFVSPFRSGGDETGPPRLMAGDVTENARIFGKVPPVPLFASFFSSLSGEIRTKFSLAVLVVLSAPGPGPPPAQPVRRLSTASSLRSAASMFRCFAEQTPPVRTAKKRGETPACRRRARPRNARSETRLAEIICRRARPAPCPSTERAGRVETIAGFFGNSSELVR